MGSFLPAYGLKIPYARLRTVFSAGRPCPSKMICDGLDITLGELFNTPEFDDLEQEIK